MLRVYVFPDTRRLPFLGALFPFFPILILSFFVSFFSSFLSFFCLSFFLSPLIFFICRPPTFCFDTATHARVSARPLASIRRRSTPRRHRCPCIVPLSIKQNVYDFLRIFAVPELHNNEPFCCYQSPHTGKKKQLLISYFAVATVRNTPPTTGRICTYK